MKRKLMTMVAGLAALALASLAMSVTPAAAGGAGGGVIENEGDGGYGTLSEVSTIPEMRKLTTRIEFYNCGRCNPPNYNN